jgi:hypothetical protein
MAVGLMYAFTDFAWGSRWTVCAAASGPLGGAVLFDQLPGRYALPSRSGCAPLTVRPSWLSVRLPSSGASGSVGWVLWARW